MPDLPKLIEIPTLGWVQPSEVRSVQIEVQTHGKTYVLMINGNRWKSSDDLAELVRLEGEIVAKVNGPSQLNEQENNEALDLICDSYETGDDNSTILARLKEARFAIVRVTS